MKTIRIFQENTETIELYDNDSGDKLEYSMKLSELLKSTDVEIIETTSGCAILKPSEIKSILVSDDKKLKIKKQIKKYDDKSVKKENKEYKEGEEEEEEKDFIGEENNVV